MRKKPPRGIGPRGSNIRTVFVRRSNRKKERSCQTSDTLAEGLVHVNSKAVGSAKTCRAPDPAGREKPQALSYGDNLDLHRREKNSRAILSQLVSAFEH